MTQTYENTFADHLGNKEFTLQQIIAGLRLKAIKYESLPNNIMEDVDNYLNQAHVKTVGAAGEDDHWITLDNGVHVLIHSGENLNDAIKRHFSGKPKTDRVPNKIYKNESIVISKHPTAEHQKTGADAAARYGLDKRFATEQARKADELRAKAEPVTQKRVDEMTKEFPRAQVAGRLKDRSQMVEKLGRKPDTYKDVSQLKDVSGVRVVSGHGIEDVKSIGKEIESKYNVIEKPENYIDNPNAGYRSLHYTIQDKETGVISEVQVRTVNEDRWATFAHDRVYKADGEQRKVLDANKGAVNSYLTGMSDYYFKLDSGIKNVKKPDCPDVIHRITGCL